jgi:hypothetical protein
MVDEALSYKPDGRAFQTPQGNYILSVYVMLLTRAWDLLSL